MLNVISLTIRLIYVLLMINHYNVKLVALMHVSLILMNVTALKDIVNVHLIKNVSKLKILKHYAVMSLTKIVMKINQLNV
jgi:hypothetical protein